MSLGSLATFSEPPWRLANPSRDRQGVPYGPRRATKSDEDASGRPNRINGLRRVFKGVPDGPAGHQKRCRRAMRRCNGINGLRRVFKGAVSSPQDPRPVAPGNGPARRIAASRPARSSMLPGSGRTPQLFNHPATAVPAHRSRTGPHEAACAARHSPPAFRSPGNSPAMHIGGEPAEATIAARRRPHPPAFDSWQSPPRRIRSRTGRSEAARPGTNRPQLFNPAAAAHRSARSSMARHRPTPQLFGPPATATPAHPGASRPERRSRPGADPPPSFTVPGNRHPGASGREPTGAGARGNRIRN